MYRIWNDCGEWKTISPSARVSHERCTAFAAPDRNDRECWASAGDWWSQGLVTLAVDIPLGFLDSYDSWIQCRDLRVYFAYRISNVVNGMTSLRPLVLRAL